MKKRIALLLSVLMMAAVFLPLAILAEEGESTGTNDGYGSLVTMGADLTPQQRAQVYADFGIAEGSVPEIKVTNSEERSYLEGLVSDQKIGDVALSCLYITLLPKGEGLDITIHHINYCTEKMYENALKTAGITDAKVIISAPKTVSGTGALTGAYKAYETLTGRSLSDIAKAIGAEELVLTGDLAQYIGSDEATAIIGELKNILDQTALMSDDEVRSEILSLAATYGVTVTDAQVEQILTLCRKMEGLDTEQLRDRLTTIAAGVQKAQQAKETVSAVVEDVKDFIASVVDFFGRLFGAKE